MVKPATAAGAGASCQRAPARSSCKAGGGPATTSSDCMRGSGKVAARASCAATEARPLHRLGLRARARRRRRRKVAVSASHRPSASNSKATTRQRQLRFSSGYVRRRFHLAALRRAQPRRASASACGRPSRDVKCDGAEGRGVVDGELRPAPQGNAIAHDPSMRRAFNQCTNVRGQQCHARGLQGQPTECKHAGSGERCSVITVFSWASGMLSPRLWYGQRSTCGWWDAKASTWATGASKGTPLPQRVTPSASTTPLSQPTSSCAQASTSQPSSTTCTWSRYVTTLARVRLRRRSRPNRASLPVLARLGSAASERRARRTGNASAHATRRGQCAWRIAARVEGGPAATWHRQTAS